MQRVTELHHLVPCSWTVKPMSDGLRLVAPRTTAAEALLQGARQSLKKAAVRMGVDLWIYSSDRDQPIEKISGEIGRAHV